MSDQPETVGRRIADRTAGRAGALVALGVWLAALVIFDAETFAPIPPLALTLFVLAFGGWLGWRVATVIARRRAAERLRSGGGSSPTP